MQKPFSYIFNHQIWRMLPDLNPESDLWAIELRDAETKRMLLAVADARNEALLWQKEVEGTDWWSTLTAFSGGRLYVHNFRYPDIPEPTDLLAYAVANGDLEWALPNYVLVEKLSDTRLKVATKQATQIIYKTCLPESGKLEAINETEHFEPGPEIILAEPVRYKSGNAYFEQLASFITSLTGHIPESIDYMEKRPFMIFSYYIYEQDKTMQYLLIVTDRREVVLHDKLSESNGMGRSTMILKASVLVYLKNNNEFSSLTLS